MTAFRTHPASCAMCPEVNAAVSSGQASGLQVEESDRYGENWRGSGCGCITGGRDEMPSQWTGPNGLRTLSREHWSRH
jgi:hypothetical protein